MKILLLVLFLVPVPSTLLVDETNSLKEERTNKLTDRATSPVELDVYPPSSISLSLGLSVPLFLYIQHRTTSTKV